MKKLLLVTVLLTVAILMLALAGGVYMETVRLKEWARTDPDGYARAMTEQHQQKIAAEG